jgi:hypothetical protein
MDKDNNINLRSPKMQRLIGDIPPRLVRCGIGIIIVIAVAVICVACFVSLPYGNDETIGQTLLHSLHLV